MMFIFIGLVIAAIIYALVSAIYYCAKESDDVAHGRRIVDTLSVLAILPIVGAIFFFVFLILIDILPIYLNLVGIVALSGVLIAVIQSLISFKISDVELIILRKRMFLSMFLFSCLLLLAGITTVIILVYVMDGLTAGGLF